MYTTTIAKKCMSLPLYTCMLTDWLHKIFSENTWDLNWFLDSGDLYWSINPINFAGLASATCLMICAQCCYAAQCSPCSTFCHSQSTRHILYIGKTCLESPWPQWSSFHDAPQHQTNDICLRSYPIHTTFFSICVLWFGDYFIPLWNTLSLTVFLLIALSLHTSFCALFTSSAHAVHTSPWSCNGFSRCCFEVADSSYCVVVDVSCALGFCLWL